MRSVKWLGDALHDCSQACYSQYGAKPDGSPATPTTKIDAIALASCFAQCDVANGQAPTVPAGGLTIPGGTQIPGGTTIPAGWTLPAGLQFPAGWTFPTPPGLTIPGWHSLPGGGTATPPGGGILPFPIPLPVDWTLPGSILIPQTWTVPAGLPLPGNLPPAPMPQPAPSPVPSPAPSPSPSPSPAPTPSPVPAPSPTTTSSSSGNAALWIVGGAAVLVLAVGAAVMSKKEGAQENPSQHTVRAIQRLGDRLGFEWLKVQNSEWLAFGRKHPKSVSVRVRPGANEGRIVEVLVTPTVESLTPHWRKEYPQPPSLVVLQGKTFGSREEAWDQAGALVRSLIGGHRTLYL